MKILVYNCREDETEFFNKYSQEHEVKIKLTSQSPNLENAQLAAGFDCLSIITTKIDKNLLAKYSKLGIKYISTRTIGYDHIDLKSAKKYKIGIGNISYSPDSVAEYTVMLILMSIRKMELILSRSRVQDYSLSKLRGRELHNLTIGIIGTGRIGKAILKKLNSFGCRLLAYDLNPDPKNKLAEYVELNQLIKKSDIISLHVPATKENKHLISQERLALMKKNSYIINTARGSLIDTSALIDALEQKKIAGASLDVIENEANIYYKDFKGEVISNRELAILRSLPNVILTPHTAFFTRQAVSDMIENSILNCINYLEKN